MKIAFIGMGNMAQALARGFIKAGLLQGKDMTAFAPNQDKLRQNTAAIGFLPCGEPKEAIREAEIVFAACSAEREETSGSREEENSCFICCAFWHTSL